jgi:HK97 family phage major capsid protein
MSILGKPIVINNQMPTVGVGNIAILFGDWAAFYVRRVKDYATVRLTERYADQGLIGFTGLGRVDSNLMDVTAIKGLVIS